MLDGIEAGERIGCAQRGLNAIDELGRDQGAVALALWKQQHFLGYIIMIFGQQFRVNCVRKLEHIGQHSRPVQDAWVVHVNGPDEKGWGSKFDSPDKNVLIEFALGTDGSWPKDADGKGQHGEADAQATYVPFDYGVGPENRIPGVQGLGGSAENGERSR